MSGSSRHINLLERRFRMFIRNSLLTLLLCLPGMASTAFYNGDPSLLGPTGGNFLDCANCRGSSLHIYDDLTLSVDYSITDLSGAWELLSANDTNIPTSAYWEIRSGI